VTDATDFPSDPLTRGITFDERVAELLEIATLDTALEVARIEYGYGGDTIELPLEPETVPVEGQHHESSL